MLKDAYEEDKTYEEMLAEALMQIPLYSGRPAGAG